MRVVAVAGLVVATGALGVGSAGARPMVPADSLTPDPASGPVGQEVHLTGTINCIDQDPGSDVLLRFVDPSAVPQTMAAVTPEGMILLGEGGAVSATFAVPSELGVQGGDPVAVTPGDYSIRVGCSYSLGNPNQVSVPFTVTDSPTPTTASTSTTGSTSTSTPTSTSAAPPSSVPVGGSFTPPATPPTDAAALTGLGATSVAAGGSISIDEPGFTPGETVDIVLYSAPTVLATDVVVAADGHLRTTVAIPAAVAAGQHTLVLFGDSVTKASTITVTAPAAADTLPRTGSGLDAATVGGLAATLAGALMLVAARRRASTGTV